MNSIFNDIKSNATPLDPFLEVGLLRNFKVKVWEYTISAGDWIFNQKRHFRAEQRHRTYTFLAHAIHEKYPDEFLKEKIKFRKRQDRKAYMDWDDGIGQSI